MKKITLMVLSYVLFFVASAQENVVYYDDFRFANNSGYQGFIVSNPDAIADTGLLNRGTDLPDETTVLGFTRPANNIGDRTDARDQRNLTLTGQVSGTNYTGVTWAVTDPVDISTYANMIVTFALRNRFRSDDGDADPVFQILATTNYTLGTDPTTVSWMDITTQVLKISDNTPFSPLAIGANGSWNNFYFNAASYIGTTGSDKFSIAFRYVFNAGSNAFSSTNRNGNWFISDVRYVENSSVLSSNSITKDFEGKIYPNPASDFIRISADVAVKSIEIVDLLGKQVFVSHKPLKSINVSNFNRGLYILKITTTNSASTTKRIILN